MTPSPTPPFAFRPGAAGVYYAQLGDDSQPAVYDRVAYLPRAASAQGAYGLAESWANAAGVYVLLGERVVDPQRFARLIDLLLADPALAGARILWVANPSDSLGRWSYRALRLATSDSSGGRIGPLASFDLRNYGLVIGGGSAVQIDPALPGFRIQPAGGSRDMIFLTAHSGATELRIVGGDVTIALAGPSAGCLSFPLTARGGAAAQADILDVGVRFFFPDPAYPDMDLVTSQRYPVFDTAATDLSLVAALDPSAPLDMERTSLAFAANHPAIPSFYRTTLGYPVSLRPTGPASRLVFAARTGALTASVRDDLYLVPDGPFEIGLPASPGGPARLLCGTFGAEYVELDQGPFTLTFAAGQPAYAPTFKVDGPDDAGAQAPGPRLTFLATTAWALVSSSAAHLFYYAQPHGAVLHREPPDAPVKGVQYYFPVRAGALPIDPSVEDARGAAYPLAPYAGVSAADLTAYTRLESQILSQQRRSIIYEHDQPDAAGLGTRVLGRGDAPQRAATAPVAAVLGIADQAQAPSPKPLVLSEGDDPYQAPGAVTAVTPQGLLALFAEDKATWKSLKIAKAGDQYMDFQFIQDPAVKDVFRAALLTNQQFLVVSNPRAFQQYFAANNQITVDGWQFRLDPALWREHGTIMIVKNCDKTLRELAGDTHSWILADAFNLTLPAVQQRIRQIIADADAQAHPAGGEANPDYQHFVDSVVDDRRWNGILFLNAQVPLAGLPPELEGLAAGIDAAHFFAHHLGISQTPIVGGKPQDSSLFGLIAYTSPAPGVGNLRPSQQYGFEVLALKVLFRNSVVQRFSSTAALTLDQLFGAPARSPDAKLGNAIVLEGAYQQHGAGRALVFGSNQEHVFALADAVLARVTIRQAQFSTVVNPPADAADDTVLARFALWGALRFQALDQPGGLPFDIFSYDALSFANLRPDMSFRRSRPTSRTFLFDASHIAFDAAQSGARPASLARHFPVKIAGLISAGEKQTPAKLGYLRIGLPIAVEQVSFPWYGLVFDLNLGTLGALAESAGFVATLVLAWSPDPRRRRLFVGLKLPGLSAGKSEFSLMGLLKLALYSTSLLYSDGGFLLKLNGINLKFLSKTLPPGGSFDFYLFGDPDPNASADSLGWYGAYAKDQPQTTAAQKPPGQLPPKSGTGSKSGD